MVDVTTKNFDEQVKIFEEQLKTCSFVAFDEEMTGIRLDPSTDPEAIDSSDARYQKMRRVASTFNIMQVGFCLFHKQEDGSYVGTPFTFYLFPCESSGIRIQMDASTAHFHKQNSMNFNKWIYDGIPFMPESKYSEMLAKIEQEGATKEEPEWKKRRVSLDKADDKEFLEFVMAHLESWVSKTQNAKQSPAPASALPQTDGADGEGPAGGGMEVDGDSQGAGQPAKTSAQPEPSAADPSEMSVEVNSAGSGQAEQNGSNEPPEEESSKQSAAAAESEAAPRWKEPTFSATEFVFPDCNAFLRKALYQEIESRFPALSLESRQVGENRYQKCIVASFPSKELEGLDKNALEKKAKLAELEKSAAFRRVYLLVAESKKPLVGHNCMFDLLFLSSHMEGDLPESYAEWKAAVHARFPTVYDTKMIAASSGNHADTMLGTLFKAAMAAEGGVQVRIATEHEEYAKSEGHHEAGYDAWMTGAVFARLGGNALEGEDGPNTNLLCVGRSFFSLNLAGEDKLESGIFHVSGFPAKTITSDLLTVFGAPGRTPLHVKNVPARVTVTEFKAQFESVGAVSTAVLAPSTDGKSDGSGFVVYEDPAHLKAAVTALHGAKPFGDEDTALVCAPLKVSVRWVNDEEAFLVLGGCNDSEAGIVFGLQSETDFNVVPLDQYFSGSSNSGGQSGRKRPRSSSGGAAQETPVKGGSAKSTPAGKDARSKARAEPAPEDKPAAVTSTPTARGGSRNAKKAAPADDATDPLLSEGKHEPTDATPTKGKGGKSHAKNVPAAAAAAQEESVPAAKTGRKRGRESAEAEGTPVEETPKKAARGSTRKSPAAAPVEPKESPVGKAKGGKDARKAAGKAQAEAEEVEDEAKEDEDKEDEEVKEDDEEAEESPKGAKGKHGKKGTPKSATKATPKEDKKSTPKSAVKDTPKEDKKGTPKGRKEETSPSADTGAGRRSTRSRH